MCYDYLVKKRILNHTYKEPRIDNTTLEDIIIIYIIKLDIEK